MMRLHIDMNYMLTRAAQNKTHTYIAHIKYTIIHIIHGAMQTANKT